MKKLNDGIVATGPVWQRVLSAASPKKPRVTAVRYFFWGTPCRRHPLLTFCVTRSHLFTAFIFCIFLVINSCTLGMADEKKWNADSAQTDWFDDANWLPAGAPTASDDVVLDKLDAAVAIGQDFNLRSLTLGGKKTSTLTVSNFVVGQVKPGNVTDIAVLNRRNGKLVLKGSAQKVTLKGAYKDSEEVIPEEPSFMFYVR